ncbi:MAG: fabG 4 [Bradyrhizobium sp.]|nr:fabG 4 [Bradyrhizobium sp.]
MNHLGKVALVTGGSGDIGGAIARRLGGEGFTVIATYVGLEGAAAATADDIIGAGGTAGIVQLDQRSPHAIEQCRAHVGAAYGRLDVLINNAAWNVGIPFADLDAMTPDIWDRVLETNLRGPFLLARAMADLLRSSGRGHIVNISSIAGITTAGSSIAYSAAKAGLNHLTRGLAVALAPDVAVNCVAPGLVENTRMANRVSPERREKGRQQAILGRVGTVGDVASQVLAFINSSSITGQTVAVDGGVPGAMR